MIGLRPSPALSLTLLLLGFALGAVPARAETYIIDPKHTEVRFVYTMGFSEQKGRFTNVSGTMDFDAKAPEKARVEAVVKTASLTTGEALVEAELKGRSFFNVERQPEIRFRSDTITLTGTTAAQMSGAITVNGITKPITLDVAIRSGDDETLKYRVGTQRFTAIGHILRSDFNMTAYGSMVADKVGIEIDALLRKTP